MSSYPFSCLLVPSRDHNLDVLIAQLLTDSGYTASPAQQGDLLPVLQARTGPAVVVKNLNRATRPRSATPRLFVEAPEVTRRHGYVFLTLYSECVSSLVASLPADHAIVVLPWPRDLTQVPAAVERVGRRVLRQWEAV
jgi:hypothetical protein